MERVANNTSKIEIRSHELRIMNELKKAYYEIRREILDEILSELISEYKLLKKE
jgi:hypothetical protein